MKKIFAFAFLVLLVSGALAQSGADGTIIRRRDFFGGPGGSSLLPTVLQTTSAPLNYFVATTGNDANSCVSTTATCVAPACKPCLTIQGTLNKVPKILQNPVMVKVGPGAFAGFTISGFSYVLPAGPTQGGWLSVQGTLVNFAPSTGTATGTATAVVEADPSLAAPASFATLTDGAQAWTVDNLRGHILEITSGPGAGLKRMIASNTATTITINGGFTTLTLEPTVTAPAAGSGYAIRDWATSINTTVNQPAAYDNIGTGTGSGTGNNNTLVSVAQPGFMTNDVQEIILDQLKYDGATGADTAVQGNGGGSIHVLRSQFTTGFLRGVTLQSLGTNYVYENAFSNLVFPLLYDRSLGYTIAFGNVTDQGVIEFLVVRGFTEIIANSFHGTFFYNIVMEHPEGGGVAQNDIDCQGVGFGGVGSFFSAPGFAYVGNNNISNCNVAEQAYHGLSLLESFAQYSAGGSNVGTGNTFAYAAAYGGKIEIDPTDTLTGTTELLIDSASYAKADLEALTPVAILSGVTGSTIYERSQFFGGEGVSANFLGDLFQVQKKPTIGTCDAFRQGSLATQFGGVGEGDTKICACTSNGAAVPVYSWCSIQFGAVPAIVCAGGNATTCP